MSLHPPTDLEKASVEATRPGDAVRRAPGYAVAAQPSKVANPGALGLFSFASTTLILSLYNAQARGISHPNVVVGMAAGCGGLVQLLAGMWEFPRGNMFGATDSSKDGLLLGSVAYLIWDALLHPFSSYGAFWISYAFIVIPGTGIRSAYEDPSEFGSAVAIYLTTWGIVTFFFTLVALRKNVTFIALLGVLTVTFFVLAAGDFTGNHTVTKAGGILGIITAFIAYYGGLCELLAAEDMAIARPPLGVFTRRV